MIIPSVTGKNWIYKKFDSNDVKNISEKYSLSEISSQLLSIRKEKIDNLDLFLNPKIKNLLPNPMILKDMNEAVERAYKSIINYDLIGIFGDYDVDGATSTALLAKYFLSIKQKIKTTATKNMYQRLGLGLFSSSLIVIVLIHNNRDSSPTLLNSSL